MCVSVSVSMSVCLVCVVAGQIESGRVPGPECPWQIVSASLDCEGSEEAVEGSGKPIKTVESQGKAVKKAVKRQ